MGEPTAAIHSRIHVSASIQIVEAFFDFIIDGSRMLFTTRQCCSCDTHLAHLRNPLARVCSHCSTPAGNLYVTLASPKRDIGVPLDAIARATLRFCFVRLLLANDRDHPSTSITPPFPVQYIN